MMAHPITTEYGNLKKKNVLVELLPWIGGGTSTAIYPYVYLSGKVYRNIHSDHPDPYKVGTVIHEEEHINRIKEAGAKYWYKRYLRDSRFRFEEELAAMEPQFVFLKKQGLNVDLHKKAKVLAGHLYFWPVSTEYALKRLNELWEQA